MEINEKIEKRCHIIMDCLHQMDEIITESSEEYSKNYIHRNAIERLVEKIVDSSTDIVAIMCRIENVQSNAILDFASMVNALEHKDVLSKKIATRLIELYGFKNRILYNYGDNEAEAAYEILVSEFFPFYQEFVEFVNENVLSKQK